MSVLYIVIVAVCIFHLAHSFSHNQHDKENKLPYAKNETNVRKIELFDGVFVKMPGNNTNKLVSIEINTKKDEESGRGKQKKLMQRILPLFILPFVIQSTIVPLFLGMLKFMLFKSLMIGKLALVLIIINAFRNSNSLKARQDESVANVHYGYRGNGMEEYGAYFNS